MNRVTRWAGAALMLPLALAACDTGDDLTAVQDGPRLSLYLTDAPGDVEAVWMEFMGAALVGDGEEVSLFEESTGLIEVTALTLGEVEELVDDLAVPAGTYGMLRLWLGDVVIQTTDGEVFVMGDPELPEGVEDEDPGEIMCPSCSQSGLKVQLHGMTVEEGDHALVADADIAQSFGHQAGKSGKWVMHPVIHTTFLKDGDENLEGESTSIAGTVVLGTDVVIPECPAGTPRSVAAFVPTATAATLVGEDLSPIMKTATVGEGGAFSFTFVDADTWNLGYEAEIEYTDFKLVFTATPVPASVEVAGDDVEGVVYTIDSASCEAITP